MRMTFDSRHFTPLESPYSRELERESSSALSVFPCAPTVPANELRCSKDFTNRSTFAQRHPVTELTTQGEHYSTQELRSLHVCSFNCVLHAHQPLLLSSHLTIRKSRFSNTESRFTSSQISTETRKVITYMHQRAYLYYCRDISPVIFFPGASLLNLEDDFSSTSSLSALIILRFDYFFFCM